MNKRAILSVILNLTFLLGMAQETSKPYHSTNERINRYFDLTLSDENIYVKSITANQQKRLLTIVLSHTFAQQRVSQKDVAKIYRLCKKDLPKYQKKYDVQILCDGLPIEYYPKGSFLHELKGKFGWGNIEYTGAPWVENVSAPHEVIHGLANRHIAVWASHGRYYDNAKQAWKWQRPNLFCTNEDLFTQTIVVPFLIPMLEKSGAVVFTPRERDWQTYEYIVDNDNAQGVNYLEINTHHKWQDSKQKGFGYRSLLNDGENPFKMGTSRIIKSTKSKKGFSLISYQPTIQAGGKYAVYVSYTTVPHSVTDAEYIVFHKGIETKFHVNQSMGGGTWVYLGTFDFEAGCNNENRVVVTNLSTDKGVVTADAVRFGGGMGNVVRGYGTSGLPRCLESARYYAQWAGAPYQVYNSKKGIDDYSDDINVRPFMTNWLAGGSCYMPNLQGQQVPIELSLALHSDAGYQHDTKSLTGSLAICTTNFNEGVYDAGVSRKMSKDFAASLLDGLDRDLPVISKRWTRRYLWDRNYSETRNPEVPSAILEMLSHQNFPDMVLGQDPNFKFTLARSIYKTILRFINGQHGRPSIIQPLAPVNFLIKYSGNGRVRLEWQSQTDPLEATAFPTSYVLYQAVGNQDFSNGQEVKATSYEFTMQPGIHYRFKVAAVNAGGESFTTQTLSAYYAGNDKKTVLIVDNFSRLSAPEVIDTPDRQGFDMNADPGVSYGKTAGWLGRQIDYAKSTIGKEGPGGLGYSGEEMAGHFVAGNDFSDVAIHANAIIATHKYNVVSAAASAVESGLIRMQDYQIVDIMLGLQRYSPQALVAYKTFSTLFQKQLTESVKNKGAKLLVSGSYIGADNFSDEGKAFIAKTFKVNCDTTLLNIADSKIRGLGMEYSIYNTLNSEHYAATSVDALSPADGAAFVAMQYADQHSAAVAYKGNDYHCITLGFPFECIQSKKDRLKIMSGLLAFIDN